MSYRRILQLFSEEGDNITLPSVISGALDDPIPEHVDKRLVDFIRCNFKKVECTRFLPSESSSSICTCGTTEQNHSEKAREGGYGLPMSVRTATEATDSFGEINFGGRNSSKYIRVSKATEPSLLLDLMYKHWKIERPNLLISVTGGAQNFTMKPRLKEVFRHGFIKAAQSTGAWIVTGGMNAGVMKHVGEAVRDYTLKHGSKNIITTIGVACWGCILNKDNLINQVGCWPANYTSVANTNLPGSKDCPLDPNHTHFMLVDDGTSGKYGVEIALRAELERAISNSPTFADRDSSEAVTVPVVCVVLEGGPNTIETVKNAIACGTPAIIVQGSGRAADILAHAYNNAIEEEIYAEDQLGRKHKQLISIMEDWLEKELKEKITNELKPHTQQSLENCLENIRLCINNRDYMTVFKLDGKDSASDIDITILKALLKSNKGKRIDRLKLALAWNRADVAREQIFTDDAVFEPEDLYDLLYKAIIQDKVEFVKLLISKGVSLKEFVTVQRLLQLYNEPLTEHNCRHLKKVAQMHSADGGLVSLRHVGEFMKSLVGHYYEPTFCKSPYRDVNPRDYIAAQPGMAKGSKFSRQFIGAGSLFILRSHLGESLGLMSPASLTGSKSAPPEFEDPANVLFMWCVLVHLKEMSLVFWDIGREDIAMALTAQHVLKSLHEKEQDSEFAVELQNQTEFFGNLAVGVLNECYMTDQSKATLLLVRQMYSFGDTTVLKMAVEADNKEFVAHPACQNLLTNIWTDRLSDDNSYFRIILALFFPMFSPLLLRFRQKEIEQRSVTEVERKTLVKKFLTRKKSKTPETRQKQNIENAHILFHEARYVDKKERNIFLRYWDQLEAFFKAPFTTFCYNSMSFFAFLLLYGIILLTDFYPINDNMPVIRIKEIVLIIWISTFLLEEFRQFLVTESSTPKQKLLNYVSDPWNMADLAAILTFYVGLGLRLIPPATCQKCFYSSRIILAFNLMMFFLRVLHMFSVHQQLGPKLVMIKQMMVDLFYFVIIIMVFISSYGITSQVILFPNQPLNIQLAKDVLSDAWWSVYGEMNIDLVSGKECKLNEKPVEHCLSSNATCSAEQCAIYGFEADDNHDCYGKEDDCPANNWIVPILLAVYALITNVMMLNLLIAMFSNTFATIQGQTNVVWKMQRFHLIQEFESRPIWPPPLIIIGHLYQAFRYLVLDRCCFKDQDTKLGFRMRLNKIEEKELINWENIYAEEYLLRTESTDESSMEKQVKETFKKSDDIMFKLDQLAESNMLSHTTNFTSVVRPKLPPMLEERFSFIEEQLKRNAQALTLLMKHLTLREALPEDITDVDEARKKDQLDRQEEIKKKKEREMERFRKEMNLHKYSRCTLYPSEFDSIIRSPVADNKVLFSVSYPTYKPPDFTSDVIIEGNYDEKSPVRLAFNAKDQMKNFSRESCLGRYDVVDGYPMNPMGRTGLQGRGLLRRWGPNPVYKVVLTKWCRDSVAKSSKTSRYLSFLSVNGPRGRKRAIPELLYPMGNATIDCVGSFIDLQKNRDLHAWLAGSGNHVKKLGLGYCDDPRNTDNAWLEFDGANYHDNDGSVLTDKNLGFAENEDHRLLSWERIHSNLDVYASDLHILKDVARLHGASF